MRRASPAVLASFCCAVVSLVFTGVVSAQQEIRDPQLPSPLSLEVKKASRGPNFVVSFSLPTSTWQGTGLRTPSRLPVHCGSWEGALLAASKGGGRYEGETVFLNPPDDPLGFSISCDVSWIKPGEACDGPRDICEDSFTKGCICLKNCSFTIGFGGGKK